MTTMWIPLLLMFLIDLSASQTTSNEARLFAFLQSRYKSEWKYTRPVTDETKNVTVGIGISLIDIQDFSPITGFGTFYCYDRLVWTDEHLNWDPKMFGGLKNVRIPSDLLWKPDIVLFNSQDMVEDRFQSMVVVESNGKILWVPRTKYHIRCYNPEDGSADYECKFKFGSWVYTGFMLDPVLYADSNQTDISEFLGGHHWDIVDNYAVKTMKKYDCCPEPYPDVTFYLKLNYRGPVENRAGTPTSGILSIVLGILVLLFRFLQ